MISYKVEFEYHKTSFKVIVTEFEDEKMRQKFEMETSPVFTEAEATADIFQAIAEMHS